MHDLELDFLFATSVIDLPVTYPDRTGLLPESAQGNYFLFLKEMSTSTQNYIEQNVSLQNAPNPFGGETIISIQSQISETFEFQVHDLLGRTLHRRTIRIDAGENRISFDGSELPDGVYGYSFSNEKGRVASKMLIKH